jgi:Fe-S-cluster containining protein
MSLSDEEKSDLCMQCQACCRYIPITLPFQPTGDHYNRIVEYFTGRGCDVARKGDYTFVRIPSECIHLEKDGHCNIYDARPSLCRLMNGDTDPSFTDLCLWVKTEKARKGN